jgi:hypothetical protein
LAAEAAVRACAAGGNNRTASKQRQHCAARFDIRIDLAHALIETDLIFK